MSQDRRRFLAASGQVLGAGWLTLNWPSISAAAVHAHEAASSATPVVRNLTPEQLRDLDAISAQIIPTDEKPGAHEAGVVYFIDNALGGFFSPHRAEFAADYTEFAAGVARENGGKRFADLPVREQQVYLGSIEGTRFFVNVRMLTIVGFMASPSYGGNRNGVGWQVIGFKDEHVFQPPFGYYDREYTGFVPYDTKGKP
jgi:gluconate 2-dehydrogenase subunit 3-like protein